MTSILAQKHPIKGTRKFELIDDEIQYTIQSPFKTESLTVVLNVLDSEPVISGSTLSFLSKVNREPLVELFLNKPDKEQFDQFVNVVQQRIVEEDFGRFRIKDTGIKVNVARLGESIEVLQKYINPSEIELLLSTLVELKANPDDVKCLHNVAEAFNALGFAQGQVITYAPYINFLLSGNTEMVLLSDTK